MTDLEPAIPPPSAVVGKPFGGNDGGLSRQPSVTISSADTSPGQAARRAGQEAGLNGQETSKNGAGGVAEQKANQQIAEQARKGLDNPNDVREALESIANPDSTKDLARMKEAETRYLGMFDQEKQVGLRERYQDRRILTVTDEATALSVKAILNKRNKGEALTGWEVATLLANEKNSSLPQETQQLLSNLPLNEKEKQAYSQWQEFAQRKLISEEDRKVLRQMLESQVEAIFLNKEAGIYNKEKAGMVREEVNQYLDLIFKAQSEGSISTNLTVGQVFELVKGNIELLALQDRAASENLLGDHGVRHLVDHNIRVSTTLADELEKQGVKFRAIDRLVLHQVMIFHDLGYAMAPVREAINKEGPKGQDAGHNVLAARYFRERIADSNDVLNAVFGREEIILIHRGILYHDKDENGKASIEFYVAAQQTEESRMKNLESIIRTADNTHAFEDKLPELLYKIPETLKIMRLLRTAGEVGDEEKIRILKTQLEGLIKGKEDISDDDKKALLMAAESLGKDSWKFNVNRICGHKPKIEIDEKGRLHITVEASAIHQEVIRLFGGESYKQLKKMIEDTYGAKLDSIDGEEITSSNGHTLKLIQTERKSDYQIAIEGLLKNDKAFQEFVIKDNLLSAQLAVVEKQLQQEGLSDEIKAALMANKQAIIKEKNELLRELLQVDQKN